MSFEDELRAVIKKAVEIRDQEKSADQDFASRWDEMRKGPVLEFLRRAAVVMKEEDGEVLFRDSQANPDNGGVQLETQWIRGIGETKDHFRHWLRFKPDRENRKIIISASIADAELRESFQLDALTDALAGAIKTFAAAIAKEKR